MGRAARIVLSVVMIVMLSGCGSTEKFQTSSIVPAADGKVVIKKDANNNHQISIRILNLAESTKLDPPRDHYVVWIVDEEDNTRNMGQIKSSSGLFSKKLVATFKTSTPYEPRKVFITAEKQADIESPSSRVILETGRL